MSINGRYSNHLILWFDCVCMSVSEHSFAGICLAFFFVFFRSIL